MNRGTTKERMDSAQSCYDALLPEDVEPETTDDEEVDDESEQED